MTAASLRQLGHLILTGFTLLLLSSNAQASLTGIWWQPSTPGTGWNCSSQADQMFCLVYSYETDGSPTFRSIIAQLSYARGDDFDTVIIATGDVYKTVNFTQTEREGAFEGHYRLGKFYVDAAGFTQTLEPFNFAYPQDLDSITGVYVASSLDYFGNDGFSQIYVIDDEVKIVDGVTYKDMIGPGVPDGRLIIDEEQEALMFIRTTDPAAMEARIFLTRALPEVFTILMGSDNDQRRAGLTCMLDIATQFCVPDTSQDYMLNGLANSTGERALLATYLPQFGEPAPAPEESADKSAARDRLTVKLAAALPRIRSQMEAEIAARR